MRECFQYHLIFTLRIVYVRCSIKCVITMKYLSNIYSITYRENVCLHNHIRRQTKRKFIFHQKSPYFYAKSVRIDTDYFRKLVNRSDFWLQLFKALCFISGESLLIIGISAVVCVITTLSLSALCTNGEVKGGKSNIKITTQY